jgi:NAD(P)-dependent dehydrogenase (short-subunit alcohol dehydrogenase family)
MIDTAMFQDPYKLHGKTVLVTGASSGIGRAVAVECARAGARLVITGRDQQRLDETMRMLANPPTAATRPWRPT